MKGVENKRWGTAARAVSTTVAVQMALSASLLPTFAETDSLSNSSLPMAQPAPSGMVKKVWGSLDAKTVIAAKDKKKKAADTSAETTGDASAVTSTATPTATSTATSTETASGGWNSGAATSAETTLERIKMDEPTASSSSPSSTSTSTTATTNTATTNTATTNTATSTAAASTTATATPVSTTASADASTTPDAPAKTSIRKSLFSRAKRDVSVNSELPPGASAAKETKSGTAVETTETADSRELPLSNSDSVSTSSVDAKVGATTSTSPTTTTDSTAAVSSSTSSTDTSSTPSASTTVGGAGITFGAPVSSTTVDSSNSTATSTSTVGSTSADTPVSSSTISEAPITVASNLVTLPPGSILGRIQSQSTPIVVDNDEAEEVEETLKYEELPTDDGKTHAKMGARFPVVISSQITSKTAKEGDVIQARLKFDLKIGDRIVAKKGAVVNGHVNYSLKARTILHSLVSPERWYRNSGCVGLAFDEIINDKGEHLPLVAQPSRQARIVKNKAEGRELGVNHYGQVTGPWAQQLRYKAIRIGLNFAMAPAGVFSFGAMPVALGVLGAANPSFAFSRPVGLNVRHRRLKGFAWGFLSGVPGSWLIEDTTVKGQEAIIKPGDEFYCELVQDFTGEPATDAQLMPGASTKLHGQVLTDPKKDKKKKK